MKRLFAVVISDGVIIGPGWTTADVGPLNAADAFAGRADAWAVKQVRSSTALARGYVFADSASRSRATAAGVSGDVN